MMVEKYYIGGKPYFRFHLHFGEVEVAISHIQAANEEKAKALAIEFFIKSIQQIRKREKTTTELTRIRVSRSAHSGKSFTTI